MRVSTVTIADVTLLADLSGALFWEEQRLLVVSDLHLEKGSSFAARGVLLPPYDTVATLSRLAAVIARHDPRMVIALGDSFHDRDAHERLSAPDREAITAMQARRDWIWISGNHDPALPSDLGGVVASEVAIGPIAFRHEPTGASGEIAGHLHPKARVSTRGRSMERRCFACDGERAVMPAFGAYTGGLSIRDAAFAKIFQTPGFMAHVLGDRNCTPSPRRAVIDGPQEFRRVQAAFACTVSQNPARRSASRNVAGLAWGAATRATSVSSSGAKPSFAVSIRWFA